MRPMLLAIALPLLLVAVCLLHLTMGQARITPADVLDAVFHYDPTNYQHVVIVLQRITRLVVALYCGAALAMSGMLLQKVLQNVLVSPSTLGISSGASTFAVLGVLLFDLSGGALFWPALVGGIAGLGLSFVTAGLLGPMDGAKLNLVLAGSMMSILFSSITAFVISLDPAAFDNLLNWLVGTIGNFDYQDLPLMAPVGFVAIAGAFLLTRAIDLLLLGDEQAAVLGANVKLVYGSALTIAVILAVTAVVVVGPIGFVGLVVPHIAKILFGETGRLPLWGCLFIGPIVLVAADIGARTIAAPQMLNVGTIMGLIGGAAFLAIIMLGVRRSAL